jgi:hypothetical protein
MSDNAPINPAPGSAQAIAEWLAYNEAELIRRRDEELIPALQRLNKVPPGASFPIIADHRLAEGKPYRDGQAAINAWFERFGRPLVEAMAPITKARFDYQRRKAEESRRRAAAEAARAAEEARQAQEAAARAMKRNPLSSDVDLKLEEAGRKAEEAEPYSTRQAGGDRRRRLQAAFGSNLHRGLSGWPHGHARPSRRGVERAQCLRP